MSTVTTLEPARSSQAIDEAACRNMAVVLSLQEAGAWSVHKSRFLGATEPQHRLFVEYPAAAAPNLPTPDIRVGEHIGVAFRRGHKKCVFTSVVLERGDYGLNDEIRVQSLTLSWPDSVQELQRRAYYRAAVPRHRNVAVEIWQGSTADRKKAGTAIWPSYTGRALDLSAGGMRLILASNQNPRLNAGAGVGLEFQPEPMGPAFLLNGLLRHIGPLPDGSIAIGLQFVGLEATVDGRKVLQQLLRAVNQYQRCELRQARLAGETD